MHWHCYLSVLGSTVLFAFSPTIHGVICQQKLETDDAVSNETKIERQSVYRQALFKNSLKCIYITVQ